MIPKSPPMAATQRVSLAGSPTISLVTGPADSADMAAPSVHMAAATVMIANRTGNMNVNVVTTLWGASCSLQTVSHTLYPHRFPGALLSCLIDFTPTPDGHRFCA